MHRKTSSYSPTWQQQNETSFKNIYTTLYVLYVKNVISSKHLNPQADCVTLLDDWLVVFTCHTCFNQWRYLLIRQLNSSNLREMCRTHAWGWMRIFRPSIGGSNSFHTWPLALLFAVNTWNTQTILKRYRLHVNRNMQHFYLVRIKRCVWKMIGKIHRSLKSTFIIGAMSEMLEALDHFQVWDSAVASLLKCSYICMTLFNTGWPKKMCTHENFNCDFD